MHDILDLDSCSFIVKTMDEPIPSDGVNHAKSFLVFIDMGTALSAELPDEREKYIRKLSAMVGERDQLTLWWFRGMGLCGEFCTEELITDPERDVRRLIEKFVVEEQFKAPPVALHLMQGAAASLGRNAVRSNRNLVGYAFINGFAHDSIYGQMAQVLPALVPYAYYFFVGEYGPGDEPSQAFEVFSYYLGSLCIYARDQFEEQVTFEETIKKVAGFKVPMAHVRGANPPEEYGMLFSAVGGQPLVSVVDDDEQVLLPVGCSEFGYFSNTETPEQRPYFPQDKHSPLLWLGLAYATALDSDLDTIGMLEQIGDVYLLNMHLLGDETGDFNRYEQACIEAAFSENCRFRQGMISTVHNRSKLSDEDKEGLTAQMQNFVREEIADQESGGSFFTNHRAAVLGFLFVAFAGALIFALS